MSGGALEGAGIVSSIVDTGSGIATMDLSVGEGVAFGLAALGAVANPFGALFSAGIGWAMEHIPFLEEPLNALAGDPDAIGELATLWSATVKTELAGARADLAAQVETVRAGWTLEAADAYAVAAAEMDTAMSGLEASCDGVADAISGAGVMVATIRAVIRDLIADFVGEIVATFFLAMAASWFTLGGSVAAFIGNMVAKGTILAGRMAGKVATLVDRLASLLSRFSSLAGLVTRLRTLATNLGSHAASAGMRAAYREASTLNTLNDAALRTEAAVNTYYSTVGAAAEPYADAVGNVTGGPPGSLPTPNPTGLGVNATVTGGNNAAEEAERRESDDD